MEKSKLVAFKVEEDVDKMLREKAEREGTSLSALVRSALYAFLDIPVVTVEKSVRA